MAMTCNTCGDKVRQVCRRCWPDHPAARRADYLAAVGAYDLDDEALEDLDDDDEDDDLLDDEDRYCRHCGEYACRCGFCDGCEEPYETCMCDDP